MMEVPEEHTALFHCVHTDTAMDSEGKWQAAFDEVVEDWHGSRQVWVCVCACVFVCVVSVYL